MPPPFGYKTSEHWMSALVSSLTWEETMDQKRKSKVRRSAQEWSHVLDRFRKSGLSQREYCQREGISLSNLQRWSRHLSANDGAFIELTTTPSREEKSSAPASPWLVECTKVNVIGCRYCHQPSSSMMQLSCTAVKRLCGLSASNAMMENQT